MPVVEGRPIDLEGSHKARVVPDDKENQEHPGDPFQGERKEGCVLQEHP